MLVFEHLDVEDGDPTAGRGSRFTTEEYQVRGFLAPDIPNHCRRMKSFSESSTGRISRAWHIRGTLPEG